MEESEAMKVEDYLNNISYKVDPNYIPSDFALEFVTFIKLVNGGDEENKTPVMHYHMLDNFIATEEDERDTINLCFRGSGKSSLKEYLMLYLGVYNKLPGLGKIPYGIYLSDSIDGGVKRMRKALEYRYYNSPFLKKYIPNIKFTDTRWEFINLDNKSTVFGGYGAKALSLDTVLYKENGTTTIGEVKVGDKIFGADGKLTKILDKSEIFNRPMYRIILKDGRSIKVCEEHINTVTIKDPHRNKFKRVNLTTKELLDKNLTYIKKGKKPRPIDIVFIDNIKPLDYGYKSFRIDPYTLGVILGIGRIRECGYTELELSRIEKIYYKSKLKCTFSPHSTEKDITEITCLKGMAEHIRFYGLHNARFIPTEYFRGSIDQRLELLQGLMDTCGSVNVFKMFGKEHKEIEFKHSSYNLIQDVHLLVYSLGGCIERDKIYLDQQVFAIPRKLNKCFDLDKKHRVAIKEIVRIEDEPSQCIRVDNREKQFTVGSYIRTHNTGIRGTRENNSRPIIALLDDLISDEDARSPTVISNVEDVVYKAVEYALHPRRRRIIWSGTPFNAKDPLYKAVESGAWKVNVYPVCEEFPCEKHEFRGAWEDRFNYNSIMQRHDKALRLGKIDAFNQEMLLRIMTDEDRLILDSDIRWYSKVAWVLIKDSFNYYITTDFATGDKEHNDFSVISVWGLNSNGDWFYIDGVCEKQTMEKNVNDLFRLSQEYKPQQVGIEVTGQQQGFINWIQQEMMSRNCFFTLASQGNSSLPGIRPNTNKMQRFNNMVPTIKAGKLYLPEESKNSKPIVEALNELSLASPGGFKSKHDDFIDTISMLADLQTWRPSDTAGEQQQESEGLWDWDKPEETSSMDSYLV